MKMGKKGKTGKTRQDKFYKLAKETGFRSRAAFKLIQLNRKFGFLQNSRVCVDLCAAPGGWLQVAYQNMPLSSLVIGVDLIPIKQVGTCVTFAEDIKSDKCRQLIRKELKTWDADIFLHDGAPNMGKSWIHDAYQQNELTLHALKLATEFMRKGGWFVSKVFRSKDYHALMWLFKKLFKKVFATKPQASRHESAEIFIVCEGFVKPDKIDPKLLDPKYIFKEMEKEASDTWEKGNQVNQLFKIVEKQKKKAVGYEDDQTMVFKKVSVREFMEKETFAELLANCNEIQIDEEEVSSHESTTQEVRECCKDLKVLGRKELKVLINWRKKLLKHFEEKTKAENGEQEKENEVDMKDVEGEEEEEDEDELDKVIRETEASEKKEERKKKKKEAKKKQKLRERIAMKMVHVGDRFDESKDDEMFDLKRITSGKGLSAVVDTNETPDVPEEEGDSDDEDGPPLKKKVVSFARSDQYDDNLVGEKNLDYVGETVDSDEEDKPNDLAHGSDVEVSDDNDEAEDGDDTDEDDENPLLESLTGDKTTAERLKRKTNVWFNKDIFNEVDDDIDEDYELGQLEKEGKKVKRKRKRGQEDDEEEVESGKVVKSDGLGSDGEEDEGEDSDSDTDSEDEDIKKKIVAEKQNEDDFETVPQQVSKGADGASSNKTRKQQILDPEGLAIASFIIQSKKNRREIEEAGFNKWVNNDKGLPDWFVKDQKQHWRNRAPVQITKEMVDEYKKRQMEINARPIKKVAEAKARKKKKALKQLEKIKKKAEAVVDKEGMGEKEKALEIKKMYKKALKRKKTETKLVVAKKGGKGVKGSKPAKGAKYKVVDPRLKKDKRAADSREKRRKGGKGKSSKGRTGGPKPKAKGGKPGRK